MRESSMVSRRAAHAPISTASITPTTAASTAATPAPSAWIAALPSWTSRTRSPMPALHGVDGEHRRSPSRAPGVEGLHEQQLGPLELRVLLGGHHRSHHACDLHRRLGGPVVDDADDGGVGRDLVGQEGTDASRPRT
jgi:hypothetical protein